MRKLIPFLCLLFLTAAVPYQTDPPETGKNIPIIRMADPTQEVNPMIALAVKSALENDYGVLPATNLHYAITHVTQRGTVFLVSVAGLDFTRESHVHIVDNSLTATEILNAERQAEARTAKAGPEYWNLQDHGVWFGMVVVSPVGGRLSGTVRGTPEFTQRLIENRITLDLDAPKFQSPLTFDPTDLGDLTEIPIAPHILPWEAGKWAVYGQLGIHPNGFSNVGAGDWVAVDFIGGPFGEQYYPNMVYAANDGTIDYICDDDFQRAVKTNTYNMYTHFQEYDDGDITIELGETFEQGTRMASLVTGDTATTCGHTTQADENYHLHFGMPDYGTWPFEKYALLFEDGCFYAAEGDPICATDSIQAEWNVPNPPPPPIGTGGTGANFWDFLVDGLISIAASIIPILDDHESIGLATNVLVYASVPLELLFWMTLTYVDMTWVLITGIIIIVGETGRFLVTVWFFIKKIIPGLAT